MRGHQYVTLKIYPRDGGSQEEFQVYRQLNQGSSWHPGHAHISKALDVFTIPYSGGDRLSCSETDVAKLQGSTIP